MFNLLKTQLLDLLSFIFAHKKRKKYKKPYKKKTTEKKLQAND